MATKPTNLAEWATGAAPIVEPSLPQKQAGWAPGTKPPAQWFNWWWKLVHQWIVWLDAFETEFHTWGAFQQFDEGVLIERASGPSTALQVNQLGTGQAMVVVGTGAEAISAESPFGGVFGTAPVGSNAAGFGLKGQTDDAVAPAIRAIVNVATGLGLKLDGTTLAGVSLLEGSATGAGARGIDILSDLWGVRGTANAGSGVMGVGSDNGVRGEGKASTNGIGVRGLGAGTGLGGRFQGGTNAPGADLIAGGGNNYGVTSVGSGNAPGVVGIGGATGVGGRFLAGTLVNTDPAIIPVGPVSFVEAGDPATSANVSQLLHRKQVNRCWALVALNGTATPTILDGVGIASVAQQTVGNGVIDVTMAQAMANTSYGVFPNVAANVSNARTARALATSTTVFRTEIFDPSAPATVLTAAQTSGYLLFVTVLGAQP